MIYSVGMTTNTNPAGFTTYRVYVNGGRELAVFNLTPDEVRYVVALDAMVCGAFDAVRKAAGIATVARSDDALIDLVGMGLAKVHAGPSITVEGRLVAQAIRIRAEEERRAAVRAEELAQAAQAARERAEGLVARGVRRVA